MEYEFRFFIPKELPIVGERFSQIKTTVDENVVYTDAEVIAYIAPEENRDEYIIIKASFSSRMIWELYIHGNSLNIWRFKY